MSPFTLSPSVILYCGRIKHLSYAGLPFAVLGTTLLFQFRTPDSHFGYLVMCKMFNGIVMASVTHQEIAVVLAMFGLFGSIGAAIEQAVARALWTNILPDALYDNLPDGSKNLWTSIYASIVTQKSYPMTSQFAMRLLLPMRMFRERW
ncbi:uncharacterized protein Z518_02357 [Rhinocladiella mackenziei CBS 650.93]|uniref:Uncharacterized protein n=1 Tax=Rhinocladiella mackenziei CBS 650.93 TaxID=1442369 RepID=A0A0D2HB89_9EURO|nr:uncharacterized protein Z518_02357 [Rhinocladiella mackenziei CBS 650.93]KIX07703.1 hypothetical protein Z518_02357 [Rhinocladiella mackenziei CBS 650.93]